MSLRTTSTKESPSNCDIAVWVAAFVKSIGASIYAPSIGYLKKFKFTHHVCLENHESRHYIDWRSIEICFPWGIPEAGKYYQRRPLFEKINETE